MNDATHKTTSPLSGTGVTTEKAVHSNLETAALTSHALRRGECKLSVDGAVMVETGVHTGRSVKDKFIVDYPSYTDQVWWAGNKKLPPAKFETLKGRVLAYLQGQELYTQDLYAGADPEHRIRVRMVSTGAWQSLFTRHMFIRPRRHDLAEFEPDWVIIHAPEFQASPEIDGVRTGTAIALDFEQRIILICGTLYAGEIKKSIFTVMNWTLPPKGVLPMHCSANIDRNDGAVALFFGLSGTGKTTLSSDPTRPLIGDDEHGWGDSGTFNFEGGCYAKVINLSQKAEPEIWAASHRFGAVLENVVANEHGELNLADDSLTENTRSCYPVEFIPNAVPSGRGGQPKNVVMLTADAFGVLPPIAKLTPEQAMYHFLSGYTAKVAGTEKGLGSDPEATFSTCFASPFLPRKPEVYGEMLANLIAKYSADCWLVNTGWSGGQYGVGKRMAIQHTRALVRAALDGSLAKVEFVKDSYFGLWIPKEVPGIPSEVLDPSQSWADKAAYKRMAKTLIDRFHENFKEYEAGVTQEVRDAAIAAGV